MGWPPAGRLDVGRRPLAARPVSRKSRDAHRPLIGPAALRNVVLRLSDRSSMLPWLANSKNAAILAHGVSLSRRGSGKLRHPPRDAAPLTPSSPIFPHRSRLQRLGTFQESFEPLPGIPGVGARPQLISAVPAPNLGVFPSERCDTILGEKLELIHPRSIGPK
jgi:hypothetical protein